MRKPVPQPLAPDLMRAMFHHIEDGLGDPFAGRCDHTHRNVQAWCDANGVDAPPVLNWLRATGGYCDCEALMNSASHDAGEA